jgi:hypothetical protein
MGAAANAAPVAAGLQILETPQRRDHLLTDLVAPGAAP